MYATLDDLRARVSDDVLYTLTGCDELDTDVIRQVLADASAHIDAYLAVRYTLPMSAQPPVLQRICIDIALYWLGDHIGRATDEQRTRYADAVAWLEKVVLGTINLRVDAKTSSSVFFQSKRRLFSR